MQDNTAGILRRQDSAEPVPAPTSEAGADPGTTTAGNGNETRSPQDPTGDDGNSSAPPQPSDGGGSESQAPNPEPSGSGTEDNTSSTTEQPPPSSSTSETTTSTTTTSSDTTTSTTTSQTESSTSTTETTTSNTSPSPSSTVAQATRTRETTINGTPTQTIITTDAVALQSGETSFTLSTFVTEISGTETTVTSDVPINTSLSPYEKARLQRQRIGIIAGACIGAVAILLLGLGALFVYRRAKRNRMTVMELLTRRRKENSGAGGMGLLDDEFNDDDDAPLTRYRDAVHSREGSLASGPGVVGMRQITPSPSSHLRDPTDMSRISTPDHSKDLSHTSRTVPTSPAPSLYRARASDTGSLFHEEGIRNDTKSFTDPFLHGANSSSNVDLTSIVDDVMGPSAATPTNHYNLPPVDTSTSITAASAAALGAGAFGGAAAASASQHQKRLSSQSPPSPVVGQAILSDSPTEYEHRHAALPPGALPPAKIGSSGSVTPPGGEYDGYDRTRSPSLSSSYTMVSMGSGMTRLSDPNSLYADPFKDTTSTQYSPSKISPVDRSVYYALGPTSQHPPNNDVSIYSGHTGHSVTEWSSSSSITPTPSVHSSPAKSSIVSAVPTVGGTTIQVPPSSYSALPGGSESATSKGLMGPTSLLGLPTGGAGATQPSIPPAVASTLAAETGAEPISGHALYGSSSSTGSSTSVSSSSTVTGSLSAPSAGLTAMPKRPSPLAVVSNASTSSGGH